MDNRDNLVRLVVPPERSSGTPDWDLVEARLGGLRLPEDYKWLVEVYGPGSFDAFLHIFQPQVSNQAVLLEYQVQQLAQSLDYLRDGGEAVPYENSELLAVGGSDNGDNIFWLRRPGDNVAEWTVVVNEARGPEWSTFDGGIVNFLVAVLSGTHRVSVFPDDFPDERPEFKPYDA